MMTHVTETDLNPLGHNLVPVFIKSRSFFTVDG